MLTLPYKYAIIWRLDRPMLVIRFSNISVIEILFENVFYIFWLMSIKYFDFSCHSNNALINRPTNEFYINEKKTAFKQIERNSTLVPRSHQH